ncbi:hypothetical protein [Bradyrhizobium cenepequi]
MFFARGLDGTNHVDWIEEIRANCTVIPGRPKDEPGIHFAACACGPMDSLMCNCTSWVALSAIPFSIFYAIAPT